MTAALPFPPANLRPYVEVLGVDLTVAVLLELGGAEVNWSLNPRSSALVKLVGRDKAEALAERMDDPISRVPLGNAWIAPVLHARGYATAEIARRLRVSDVTVRQYLRDAGASEANPRPAQDGRQLPLF